MVQLGTCMPFDQVPTMFCFFTGVTVNEDTVRRLTERAGEALVALETTEAATIARNLPPPPAGPAVQQVSVDGAMVPVTGGDWVEVRTVAIGTVERYLDANGESAARSRNISYFSRYATAEVFSQLAIVATHRRGTETAGTVCGVMDGAGWLQSFLDLHRPGTRSRVSVRILDFPHAVEYLSRAAQAVFGAGTDVTTAWLEQQAHALKHEDAAAVIQAVHDLPATTTEAQEVRDRAVHYLQARREQIRYADFRALGYPIGSGMVESANKLVIEARLKGSRVPACGCHWKREHISPMAALRCAWCSRTWEEAWPQIWREMRRQTAARKRERHLARRPPPPDLEPVLHLAAEPAVPLQPILPRERLMVDGKPTWNHPWRW